MFQKVIKFVIKRFDELKSYGGQNNDNFLEVRTIKQIFQTFNLNNLISNKENEETIKAPGMKKGFTDFIKETEDKIMDDKNKVIEDPIFEVMKNKVLVLDSFKDIPKPRFLGKHLIYEIATGRSLLSKAESRINYYHVRMKFLEDQILKDNRFERARLMHSDVHQERTNTTCLNRINAVLGSSGKICCLGIIVTGEDGNIHLEDETMRVRLNLTHANSDQRSYF